jgi:hypothetical protein
MNSETVLSDRWLSSKAKVLIGGLLCGMSSELVYMRGNILLYLMAALICGQLLAVTLRWLKKVNSRAFYRLIVFALTAIAMSLPSLARADDSFSSLNIALGQGLGVIMLFAVPTGVVMIIRGIMMDRHDGAWKWEILKGLALAGAPTIINMIFNFFLGNTFKAVAPSFTD